MSTTPKKLFNTCCLYFKQNIYKLILIFSIYFITILSIGIVNYPYIDDSLRQITGITGFAESYCRWGSEISSQIIQGSRHLTDMGLTTHIITAITLGFSSIIAVYVLNDKKFSWVSAACSTIIGLNPWFLGCISFRFDSPYMALSVLLSIVPFLWWEKSKKSFFVISILGIFLMCNTYQSSSGIYIVMTIALIFKDLTNNHNLKDNYKKYLLSIIAYIFGMMFYVIETKFCKELNERGEIVKISNIKDMPYKMIRNTASYFKTIYEQSAKIWIVLFILIILTFIVSYIFKSKSNYAKNAISVILYLTLGSVLSYGAYLIFSLNLADTVASPRNYYGFGFFVAITLIILSNQKINFNILNVSKSILSFTFVYYIFSFNLTYASMLNYQKEEFERQSIVFTNDIKNIVNEQRKTIYANKLFKDSPVFTNTARNYPLLYKLIESNSTIYWPSVMLFNTYSGLNVNICSFDFSNFDSSDKKLEISNYYYDIFTSNNEIFVFMK